MSRSIPPRVLIITLALGLTAAVLAPRVDGQAAKEPGTVILKGSPLGGVKFEHKLHAHDRGAKCETCHHPSKPEKALKGQQQRCQDCHTKAATPPMKTATRDAFHDPMAKKGICVDCHAGAIAKGKKAPAPSKCADCHKKENV